MFHCHFGLLKDRTVLGSWRVTQMWLSAGMAGLVPSHWHIRGWAMLSCNVKWVVIWVGMSSIPRIPPCLAGAVCLGQGELLPDALRSRSLRFGWSFNVFWCGFNFFVLWMQNGSICCHCWGEVIQYDFPSHSWVSQVTSPVICMKMNLVFGFFFGISLKWF